MNLVTTSLVFARLIELLCTGVEQESVVVTAFVLLVAASSGEAAPSSISFPDLDRGGGYSLYSDDRDDRHIF